MSGEPEFLALSVFRVKCVVEAQDWFEIRIGQYPGLSLARGYKNFLAAPAESNLVGLNRLLVRGYRCGLCR